MLEPLLLWLIPVGIVAFIAWSKGRSVLLWLVFALWRWPRALWAVLEAEDLRYPIWLATVRKRRYRCPLCREPLRGPAKTCPHCGRDIPGRRKGLLQPYRPAKDFLKGRSGGP